MSPELLQFESARVLSSGRSWIGVAGAVGRGSLASVHNMSMLKESSGPLVSQSGTEDSRAARSMGIGVLKPLIVDGSSLGARKRKDLRG